MKDFRNLKVWNKSHSLTLNIYRDTEHFPHHEVYGLTSQLRRACVSIPTNIAEGCGRGSDADMKRFMQIAMGSASETEYLILLATELGYLSKEQSLELSSEVVEVKQMLSTLIQRLKADY
ncbi:MAG: four helix bundle protein [Chloroflexota bacterium]